MHILPSKSYGIAALTSQSNSLGQVAGNCRRVSAAGSMRAPGRQFLVAIAFYDSVGLLAEKDIHWLLQMAAGNDRVPCAHALEDPASILHIRLITNPSPSQDPGLFEVRCDDIDEAEEFLQNPNAGAIQESLSRGRAQH